MNYVFLGAIMILKTKIAILPKLFYMSESPVTVSDMPVIFDEKNDIMECLTIGELE